MASKSNPAVKYSAVNPTFEEQSAQKNHQRTPGRFQKWRSLLWMILALGGGIALAIGHHFFYASYDGHQVERTSISQAWIVRIGTGMAFVVKTMLVLSASIACTQLQWLTTRSRPFKIRQIDAISSVLSNIFAFFETRVWLRVPLLSLLAVITWLLPITAIITPATITVVSRQEIDSSLGTPPQLYYDPTLYGNLWTEARTDYTSPSYETLRIAYGSAMTGQILSIPTTNPNMSYNLQFIGPALRCDPASETLIQEVYEAYIDELTGIENQYYYISWVPNGNNLSLTDFDATVDVTSLDAAHLYIIPNTTIAGPIFVGGEQVTPDDMHYGYQDLLDCQLFNASYQALFNFSFPYQTVEIRSRDLLNPVNLSIDISQWYYSQGEATQVVEKQAQRISYQSIMDSLGRLLVGREWTRDGVLATEKTSRALTSVDWTTRDTTQEGVEELFQNMTLSMLSSPLLTMNATIAAQKRVSVDVRFSVNIYRYSARDLWLAYGIGMGASLLCTVVGAYAMWRNKAGYQNVFSTFVRTTRDRKLQESIDHSDRGSEPLPRDFAEVTIMLGKMANDYHFVDVATKSPVIRRKPVSNVHDDP